MVCATVLCMVALAGPAGPAGPASGVAPEAQWFTLLDEADQTPGNVIQVRPEPVSIDDRVMLQLRVSRDAQRTSFRGQIYRSYEAKVVINCSSQKAWYLWLSYYPTPRWAGPPIAREDYAEGQAQVLFKDIPGELYNRMVAAACKRQS